MVVGSHPHQYQHQPHMWTLKCCTLIIIFPNFNTSMAFPILFLLLSLTFLQQQGTHGCYTSIFSFGDSLTDTGNSYAIFKSDPVTNSFHQNLFLPPYGDTYFHSPGRCSNGRLIIDFIAESLGLPFLPAYLQGGENGGIVKDFKEGVNFAVVGATALDSEFFEKRGVHNIMTNDSLEKQLDWFKALLSSDDSLCPTFPQCREFLINSLILVGEIGGNDYNDPFSAGKGIEEITTYVPLIIQTISSTIIELIELGAVTLMVPGNFPIGCSSAYLTQFQSPDEHEYDSSTGCLSWLNRFSEYHNQQLQIELDHIRNRYPHTTIIYADFYNAAMTLYKSPSKFGFSREGALAACCGGGGPYNYNSSRRCGNEFTRVCDEPSSYISWDGVHLTEAAYRWIAHAILQGSYTNPNFNSLCLNYVQHESDGQTKIYKQM